MKYICTDLTLNSIQLRGIHMFERKNIQKRIWFLQRSLVQLSFTSDKNRPQLYLSLIKSLHKAQRLLIENKKLETSLLKAE
jgi:hypothetical protein